MSPDEILVIFNSIIGDLDISHLLPHIDYHKGTMALQIPTYGGTLILTIDNCAKYDIKLSEMLQSSFSTAIFTRSNLIDDGCLIDPDSYENIKRAIVETLCSNGTLNR